VDLVRDPDRRYGPVTRERGRAVADLRRLRPILAVRLKGRQQSALHEHAVARV
jgi:hypothetical protein